MKCRQHAPTHDDGVSKRNVGNGKTEAAFRQNENGSKGSKSRENVGGSVPKAKKGAEASWETGLEDDEGVCKRTKVYDRLYHQGVVKVKRQQQLQVRVCFRGFFR